MSHFYNVTIHGTSPATAQAHHAVACYQEALDALFSPALIAHAYASYEKASRNVYASITAPSEATLDDSLSIALWCHLDAIATRAALRNWYGPLEGIYFEVALTPDTDSQPIAMRSDFWHESWLTGRYTGQGTFLVNGVRYMSDFRGTYPVEVMDEKPYKL